jgi:hypothetical protein
MAFGKDPNHLNSIPSFGQGNFAQQANTSSKKAHGGGGGGGGGPAYWRGNFEISEYASHPTRFRLIRGDYTQQYMVEGQLFQDTFPYFMYTEHGRSVGKTFRGGICSGGPMRMDREKREPCEGCELFWQEYQARQADKAAGGDGKHPRSMSMNDKFAFNVLDYGYFFEMPDVDDQGRVRTKKDGSPWMHWEKAFNVQDPKYHGRNWTEGRVQPWGVNNSWRTTLVNQSIIIGNSCGSCGQGHVQSRGWYCGNPQCRQLLLDPYNTSMTPDQQEALTKNAHHCPHCGYHGYPHEEVQCNACANGKRATIFDADLYGFKEKSGDSKQTKLVITQFYVTPIRFQTQSAVTPKPLDLPKIFAPTPIDKQRVAYGLGAPQGQQGGYQQPPAPHQQGGYQQPNPQWGAPPAPPTGPMAPQPQYVDPHSMNQGLAQHQGGNQNNGF